MATFFNTPEELRAAATKFENMIGQITTLTNRIENDMHNLTGSGWKGDASNKMVGTMTNWQDTQRMAKQNLTSIADGIRDVASKTQEQDSGSNI